MRCVLDSKVTASPSAWGNLRTRLSRINLSAVRSNQASTRRTYPESASPARGPSTLCRVFSRSWTWRSTLDSWAAVIRFLTLFFARVSCSLGAEVTVKITVLVAVPPAVADLNLARYGQDASRTDQRLTVESIIHVIDVLRIFLGRPFMRWVVVFTLPQAHGRSVTFEPSLD